MKLAVITDVHANLPALEAALDDIDAEGVDLLVHPGDAIAIGPFPAECLDRLLNVRDAASSSAITTNISCTDCHSRGRAGGSESERASHRANLLVRADDLAA